MQISTLTTDRLTLRPLKAEDFDVFANFFASDRSKFVGGPVPPEQSWRMLAVEIGHWSLRGYGRWAVEETKSGLFAGVIGPWNPEGWPEPEIGWDLMAGFEGNGYATEAASAALSYAFETLEWPTAISLVAVGNDGSRRVAQRLGATQDGMFDHPRFGSLEIWRHSVPKPKMQARTFH